MVFFMAIHTLVMVGILDGFECMLLPLVLERCKMICIWKDFISD